MKESMKKFLGFLTMEEMPMIVLITVFGIIFLFCCAAFDEAFGQSYTRQGKVFVQSNTTGATRDTLQTDFLYKDSKGVTYPIVIGKVNGRCWVWKVSSKTGRMYKMYLKQDLCEEVCKETGITYIEKKP